MNFKKKVALVVCYFGQFPWYFKYFLLSCKYNPTIDFFLITDNDIGNQDLPANVRVVHKELADVCILAGAKLQLKVDIQFGYKFCDFKPAYGVIFSDFLKGYDVWGHCDIDVIFGDIRHFMTDELLNKFDVISVRADWLPGCFLLFKNVPKVNRLFSYSKDYKKVFTSPYHYCFDETNFTHHAFTKGKPYNEIESNIESMTHVVKKMEARNYIKAYFDLHIIEGGSPGKLIWDRGKLIYKNRFEVLLYHLIDFKRHYEPDMTLETLQIPDRFKITPTKIYHVFSEEIQTSFP